MWMVKRPSPARSAARPWRRENHMWSWKTVRATISARTVADRRSAPAAGAWQRVDADEQWLARDERRHDQLPTGSRLTSPHGVGIEPQAPPPAPSRAPHDPYTPHWVTGNVRS